jgi:hypothetical protein
MTAPTLRRSNADRAERLIAWGMDAKRRDKTYTKQQLAEAIGMGVGQKFDAVLTLTRDLCHDRGWNFGYFHPLTNGAWVSSFTKIDVEQPLPGVAQRANAIAKQSRNVRKQIDFMRDHSGRDTVARHMARIVEAAEANQLELNSLLRALVDRMTTGAD